METPNLVIGVPYDGVAQNRNGKERQTFESLIQVLLGYTKIPATLCCYTEGVRWLTHESPYIEQLREISERGADILACRATVAEADLLDDLMIGQLTAPDQIDDLLLEAEHAMVL